MIFIVPLVPIAIFLFLFASGLVLEISDALPTLHIILALLVVVGFVLLFFYVLFNGATVGRRATACVLTALSCVLSLVGLDYIVGALASVSDSFLMVFEFALVLIFGGGIWLFLVVGAMWLCAEIAGA